MFHRSYDSLGRARPEYSTASIRPSTAVSSVLLSAADPILSLVSVVFSRLKAVIDDLGQLTHRPHQRFDGPLSPSHLTPVMVLEIAFASIPSYRDKTGLKQHTPSVPIAFSPTPAASRAATQALNLCGFMCMML